MKRLLAVAILTALAAAPALADPKADLLAAMSQLSKAASYHATAVSRGQTVEFDSANAGTKMRVATGPMEMIKIDQTMWVKMNGSWRKMTIPGAENMTAAIDRALATVRNSKDDAVITDLGMKSPDGAPLHAYGVTNKSGTSPSTVYLDGGGTLARIDTTDGTVIKFSKYNAIEPIVAPN
jgi:hypothetical protein